MTALSDFLVQGIVALVVMLFASDAQEPVGVRVTSAAFLSSAPAQPTMPSAVSGEASVEARGWAPLLGAEGGSVEGPLFAPATGAIEQMSSSCVGAHHGEAVSPCNSGHPRPTFHPFPPSEWGTAALVSFCESSWNPQAIGDDGLALGFFQVRTDYHPDLHKKYDLMVVSQNVEAAYELWETGGWAPWESSRFCWGA